jgi:aldehyde:ferredoxin oxidoreductase
MPYGYNGKILHVNLTKHTYEIEEPPDVFYRKYLGGKGFVAYYMLQNVAKGVDPLSPDNILTLAAGSLTGCSGPGLNRFSAGAKSPLSGVYGDSESGGFWGTELKLSGYDAIVLRGKAAHPVYLWIDDGKVEFRDARHIWGRTTGEAQDAIRAELGRTSREARVLGIGPAGERLVRFALLVNELRYFNGRGGMGAVMGSKNLKAVAVRGTKKPELANPEAVMAIVKTFAQTFKDDPRAAALNANGTPGLVAPLNAGGMLPTRNFRSGSFDKANLIDHTAYNEQILKSAGTCFACPIRCKRDVAVDDGVYKVDARFGGPEYETIGALGSGLEVSNLKSLAWANQLCGEYGLDSISAGVTIQFATECFERGLLTTEDTGGMALRFGDEAVMLKLLEMIAYRQGVGDWLADGVKRMAARIGRGSEDFAMHVKGQEIPLHEPRGKFNVGIGYAVSETGADHLRAAHDTSFATAESVSLKSANPLGVYNPVDPLASGPDKMHLFTRAELTSILWNCVGGCFFVYAPRGAFDLNEFVTLARAVTGWNTSLTEMLTSAERVLNVARAFNLREGLGRADDTLPRRFFEPLEGGRLQGKSLKRDEFEQALTWYYQLRGWDGQTGMPSRATLADLELEWVAEKLGILA